MITKIAPMTALVITLGLALSCVRQPAADAPSTLDFVIDAIAEEEWSHFDDGSFDVHHSVTARVTAPAELRGRIVKIRINPLAPTVKEATVGSQWSLSLSDAKPDDDQLQRLVYAQLTRTPSER